MCDHEINEEYNNLHILKFLNLNNIKKKTQRSSILPFYRKISYKYYLNQIIILIISNNNLPFFS